MDAAELEKNILGSMINDSACLSVGLQVIPDEFAFRGVGNQAVFKTIFKMAFDNKMVDVFTVRKQLEADAHYKYVGDDQWGDIVMYESELHIFEKHAEIFVDDYRLRKLLKVAEIVCNKARGRESTSHEIISSAMTDLEQIMRSDRTIAIVSAGKIINEIKKDVIDIDSGAKKQVGIPCGYDHFGQEFLYSPGDLIIVGARPSMGKSAWMIQLAKKLCVDQKVPVGIISLEMRAKENLYRMLANIMDIDSRSIEKGFYHRDERESFYSRSVQFMNMPLFINETYDMDYIALRANVVTMVRNFGCKIIFIDHLGLVNIIRLIKEVKSTSEAIGQVTRMLKITATELNVSIVALNQLSREVEQRTPPRPMLSDLRASGNIEQDANKVLFLYRPDYYAQPGMALYDSSGRDLTGITEVMLAKNRNGKVGHYYFHTDQKKSRYTEADDFNNHKPSITKSKR